MRRLKRLLLILALLLVGVLGVLLIGYYYLQGTPEFYHAAQWTAQQRAELGQRVIDKFNQTRTVAQHAIYDEIAAARNGTTPAAGDAQQPLTVTLTEDELNAFILNTKDIREKNVQEFRQSYEQYVTDPGIYLRDGQIILAGTSKNLGYVVSLYFTPSVDDKGLHLHLTGGKLGRLPLPKSLMDSQLARLSAALATRVPKWQAAAKMDDAGACNSALVDTAMAKLLLSALADQPAAAVLFLPVDERQTYTPLRLTRVKVGEEGLAMTLAPMTRQERRDALAEVRKPLGAQ